MTDETKEKPPQKRRGPKKLHAGNWKPGECGNPATMWKPGQSGNPAGNKNGNRHHVTRALEVMLDGEAEQLTRKCVEMALAGDVAAMRMVLDRIIPIRRDAPVRMKLPKIEKIADLPGVTSSILQAAADGDITPGEAETLGKLVEGHRRALETSQLEERIAALEQRS